MGVFGSLRYDAAQGRDAGGWDWLETAQLPWATAASPADNRARGSRTRATVLRA